MTTENIEKQQAIQRMERDRKMQNLEKQYARNCIRCKRQVPDWDFSCKFMQAGGHLHGPFCSERCYYKELMDE